MLTLGLSAFYHDSAAAVLRDGVIVAAAQEERFTRRKHDSSFPGNALRYCLKEAGARGEEISQVVFYDKPLLKFERLLETYLAFAPRGFSSFRRAMPLWLKEKLFQKRLLREHLETIDEGFSGCELLFAEHHLSHAASAFYPSPFEDALILTMDGVGEWATTSAALGRGNRIEMLREIHFPHSLGLLYSAFTYYLGFRVNSGEYKVMGLAPYGEPKYAALILERLVDLKADGSFRLDLRYFDYCTGLTMTNRRFDELFGRSRRESATPLEKFHADMAASIQAVTEEAVLRLTRSLQTESGARNLCLAGGVALNCVVNGRILREGRFEKIWIQPAAGDAGGALGAALVGHHLYRGASRILRNVDGMSGSLLGPGFPQAEIEQRLRGCGARFEILDEAALLDATAGALARGKVVGWFQGRMEFGPRALGARSILADPRPAHMKETLNRKIKQREGFRPFAPLVTEARVAEWFALEGASPYMLLTVPVNDVEFLPAVERSPEAGLTGVRSQLPAVTHVDGSARVQTVSPAANPRLHALLERFGERTGCPVLVNTSFNVRGEPLVCTPEDAFRCFMGTEIDVLAIGNCFLRKDAQDPALENPDFAASFEPD